MRELLPVVVLVLGMLFVVYHNASQQSSAPSYSSFEINGKSFAITYVATNQSSWENGLMNKTIGNSTTMLFVFPNRAIYPFWMMDTYSSLDMLWIDGNATTGEVVYIVRNASSCFDAANCTIYTPNALANYVIEVKSGFADKWNISIGDQLMIN